MNDTARYRVDAVLNYLRMSGFVVVAPDHNDDIFNPVPSRTSVDYADVWENIKRLVGVAD
jgi:hypothetical protein